MTKKKRYVTRRKGQKPGKRTAKLKGGKCDTVTEQINLENPHNDLQSKFKLKELRIVLYDIAADNTILPCQKAFISKNNGSMKGTKEHRQCTNKKIRTKKNKSFVNNVVKLGFSNVTSSLTITERHGSNEKINNDLNIGIELSCAESISKYRKSPLVSNVNDNAKEKEYKVATEVECMQKHENADTDRITVKNSNQNLCPDLLNQTILVPNVCTKRKGRMKNLNSDGNSGNTFIKKDHSMEDKHSIKQMDEKSPEVTQRLIRKDAKKTRAKKCVTRKLPKIKRDNILPKNTITLVKMQDRIQILNKLQDTTSSTNAVSQEKSNKCLPGEALDKKLDLTVDNVQKFTKECNEHLESPKNHVSLNANESLQSSMHGNSIDITLKNDKGDQSVPRRKRNWTMQNEKTQSDTKKIKRIKLDRRHVRENGCTTTNNSVCLSYNNSNSSFKCSNIIMNNNNMIEEKDNHLTLYSDNGNALCKIELTQESIKADSDIIFRSTNDVEKNISNSSHTILDKETKEKELLSTKESNINTENVDKSNLNESKILSCSTQLNDQKQVENKTCDDNNDDNDDDDCISLYAGSLTSLNEMVASCNENKQEDISQDYKMTGNTFKKYWQQNILECDKAFDTIEEPDILRNERSPKLCQAAPEKVQQNSIHSMKELSINANISSVNSNIVNNNNISCSNKNYNKCKQNAAYNDKTVVLCTNKMESITYERLYNGYCFTMLRRGYCNRTQCRFYHDFQTLVSKIIFTHKHYLASVINYTYSMKYHYFVKRLYLACLEELNVASIMELYQKLYPENVHEYIVCATIRVLVQKGMKPKNVIDFLCKFLIPTDNYTPQYILNSIKDNIEVGEYWNTLHNLLVYVKPQTEVIERIINDCIITCKHIEDVYHNLIKKLSLQEINQLDNNLMLSFNNLLVQKCQKNFGDISSRSVTNNEGSCEESYMLHSISNLPEPHSQYRDRFWKLYLMLYNIKEALVHDDYDYVINILDMYEEKDEDESLFSRCCFRMLCTEIKHSEYRISKIIEHAVQAGASSILYKVLLDVATYILMKLIIEEAWVLAYKLLKTLQMYNLQHSAMFIILSAEIYLANKHAIKAFTLLKQSNIMCVDRNNWNVASNAEDFNLRTNIIRMLLDVLCTESPEHAFFMFQFLVKDQTSNFQPIDLTYYVDKLMLKFLTDRKIDLIIKMGYMIIEYNFTFFNGTICRAVIATLVHNDMILAKQLYRYATGLGIYRTIELSPVIHIIINVDWVEEEIYLTFFDLFQRLVVDIGHSIDRFNPTQLSIYIIFKVIPEVHLYDENFNDQQQQKISVSKNLVREVLRTQFEPPIPFVKKGNAEIIKLQHKAVVNHLRSTYKNYI
ncbi:hypothetical protein KPH14_010557 [Odynerus spinipes]|uniref:Uncharacterized protein n=1 Tax=Odynerus spinipes TaxID=1348599 RepID=A0AAD9RU39_9HYME|nr:hypothetical protein KPH14_010557 [Odynerus spinipes]